jgi:hypothetical protein
LADAAAMLFWALLASGQINTGKIDGWQTLAARGIDTHPDTLFRLTRLLAEGSNR